MAAPAAVLQILVNAQTKGAIAQLTALDAKLQQSETRAKTASTGIGKTLTKAGKAGAVGLAAGLGFALFSATKKTMEFDAQLSSLQAVTKANRAEMKRFEKQAITMGAATVFSATEAAQAQIELAKGGLSVKQIMGGGLSSALALAAAGELSLSDAASVTVNAMKLFKIEGDKSMQVADMLATAANTTTGEVRDFAMALSQGGSVAKQAGYDLNDTVVVLEALAEAGIKNSDAGTSMKAAFVQLLGPTEKQKELADKLGMSFVDQSGKLKDAAGLSLELRDGLRGMTDAQRAATLKTLAGTDGFRTLAALYDAGSDKLKRLEKANERQGTAAKVARDKNNNLKGDLEQLSGAYETLEILIGNKVNPTLRRMAGWVTRAVNAISGLISQNKRGKKSVEDFEQKNKGLIAVLKIVWSVVKIVISIFKLFTGLIFDTGNTLKRLREIAGNVGQGMKAVFEGAWLAIRTTFRDGANAVVGIVNSIIGVLNKIPGVDIGEVGMIYDPSLGKDANGPKALGRQRGGPINIGKPSGDSVPAMLERGEYVLNRNAVRAVGKKQLDAVNFGMASRFQVGGPVGLIGGGIADAVGNAASTVGGAAAGLAGKALGKGAGFFINRLPEPNLPSPFTALGPWLIEHVTDWIKGKVPKLGGSLGNVSGNLGQAMALAQQMGLTITSTTGGAHAPGSYHYSGRAFDASNGVNTPEMQNYFMAAAGKWGSSILELFYDPIGWYIKNGAKVPGAIGGHSDHVHTAMQQGGFIELMRGGPTEHKVVKNVGKFLLNRGFDFRATAGILGNAWREGLWNPAQMEFSGASNGGLYGFTTSPVSLEDMKAFAARRGKRWDDEIVQTNFMLSHGNPPGIQLRSLLNQNTTIAESAEDFMTKWERPDMSVSGLSERIAAGHDASNILRQAGIVKAGAEGGDEMSAAEEAKAERKNRKKFRMSQVDKLLKTARSARSVQGKKGAYWQILDMYAKYGDFGFRKAQAANGGVVPEYNEAAEFLSRAGRIASIKDPNRGAGQLYSLVGWLQDHVGLTGSDNANEALSNKLQKTKEAGGERAKAKRQKLYQRMAKYGTDFPWKAALNKNAQRDEVLDDLSQIIARQNTAEWSEFGSEYSQPEIDKERNAVYKLFVGRDNRYRMLMDAIPWAEKAEKFYRRKIDSAGPGDKWLLPGYRKGLKAVTGLLDGSSGTGLRDDLKQLVGAAGVAGISVGGGTRGDAFYRWQELGGMKPGGLGSTGISIGDLRQIIDFAAVGGYGSVPKFHTGGIVPGTGERPAMVMGGEGVFTRDQMAAMGSGNITINVKFRDDRLKDLISFEIEENDRQSDQFAKAGGV